jgi:hypothetical protein
MEEDTELDSFYIPPDSLFQQSDMDNFDDEEFNTEEGLLHFN